MEFTKGICEEFFPKGKKTCPFCSNIIDQFELSCPYCTSKLSQDNIESGQEITQLGETSELMKKGGVLEVALIDEDIDAGLSARHGDMTAGPYAKLRVSDTGHGMPPDILERVFEPYFTTKGRGEGTGLGLSVTHGIVNNYGEVIHVKSELDKGSVFEILLPRVERERTDEESESPEAYPTGTR